MTDGHLNAVQLSLAHGVIEGVAHAGVHRYLSIPYAAPVTEALRFAPPQPVAAWQGVRDCTRPGPSAPQERRDPLEIDMAALVHAEAKDGPDFLTLNVWTPAGATGGRPVMVFIHGGSFSAGSKDAPVYDGAAFARDGVVLVSINYRLGILGFLPIPGVPTNLGLRDAIAALEWVRDNIAAFGGDPAQVTVFGESAGACIAELVTLSPLARGLVRRLVLQSGHALLSRDAPTLQSVVRRIARKLRVTPDRAGFESVSTERLLAAQAFAGRLFFGIDLRDRHGVDLTFGAGRFLPVHGDDVAPTSDVSALANGTAAGIDMLIGTNADEGDLFFVPGGAGDKLRRWMVRLLVRRGTPRSKALLVAYGLKDRTQSAGRLMSRVMTDFFFRAPARSLAARHRGRSWVYEFDWRSPACGGRLGAAHAVELPFVFDTLAAAAGPRGVAGTEPPQDLADRIHGLWVAFASGETLPWPTYSADQPLVFSLSRNEAALEPAIPAAAFLSPG